jgi:hypothetical protein
MWKTHIPGTASCTPSSEMIQSRSYLDGLDSLVEAEAGCAGFADPEPALAPLEG